MIKSLTGFGSAEISSDSSQVSIIIRSVNARFLDIKFRGLDLDSTLEMDIRAEIQKSVQRGNVQIQIFSRSNGKNNTILEFDRKRYESIEKIIQIVQKEYGRRLELSDLISINDLTVGFDFTKISNSLVLKGVQDALKQLDEMRMKEGLSIVADIKNRLGFINKSLEELQQHAEGYVKELKATYHTKILSLLDDIKVDEDRLAQEVAINIDRYDFTEEIVRGLSHCNQFYEFLESNEPVGKKLNFLLQELSREVNTIGSKNPKSELSNIVVELKSEIEKIREQVQNVL